MSMLPDLALLYMLAAQTLPSGTTASHASMLSEDWFSVARPSYLKQ